MLPTDPAFYRPRTWFRALEQRAESGALPGTPLPTMSLPLKDRSLLGLRGAGSWWQWVIRSLYVIEATVYGLLRVSQRRQEGKPFDVASVHNSITPPHEPFSACGPVHMH
jgi:hypothetical protein